MNGSAEPDRHVKSLLPVEQAPCRKEASHFLLVISDGWESLLYDREMCFGVREKEQYSLSSSLHAARRAFPCTFIGSYMFI